MIKLFKYLKPFILQIIVICLLVFIQAMTDLQLPDYMSDIINNGIVAGDNDVIWRTGLLMLGIALIGGLCAIGVGFLSARVSAKFAMNVREKLFTKVEGFSLAEFDKFSTASLITRSTNDVMQVQMVLIMIFRMVLSAPILGVGAVLKALSKESSLTWIMILAVSILVGIIILLFSIALPKFKVLQKLIDKLNLVTRENLTGIRVIRAFNTEKYEEEKFDKANKDLTAVNLFVSRLMVVMMPFMMLLMNGIALTIVWVGSYLIDANKLAIGDMMAFIQYSMQVIIAFLFMSIVFIMVPRASVSAQRIMEVLNVVPIINDPKVPKYPDINYKGTVEFRNVWFSYPDADTPVLEDINFTALPGETTAFIGSTGSGKTTLINLIPRFYDITSGSILVDNVDIREMKQEELRSKLGYVPQKGVLFSGNIEDNIKFGNELADMELVEDASKTAQAYDFINEYDDKFQTAIAQGGTNVSGGQKQRLAIARAIVRNPEIYIFDDSFSALDFKTDATLRKALSEKTKDATVLIVAQRVSTIMYADKILVIDEGKIVGEGTHRELLKNCSVYNEIATSQLSKEELA